MSELLSQRSIGRGLSTSVLGFGAGSLGNLFRAIDDDQARATVDRAWDNGYRYFDTAPHYGVGLSERRLGEALADRPRDEYVLSTKVGRLLIPQDTGESDIENAFDTPATHYRLLDYSRSGVRRSLEESLERLGLDRIDIALVHDADDHVDQTMSEALPELARMRDEGIISAIGVGMNQWQAPLKFMTEGEAQLDVIMLAGRWTLLDRSGKPLLDAVEDHGVKILAAAPFNSGLLARDEPDPDAHYNYMPAPPEILDAARKLAALAREFGTTLPAAALQFPLRHPAVASALNGYAKPAYSDSAVHWLGEEIPDEFWAAADQVQAELPKELGLS